MRCGGAAFVSATKLSETLGSVAACIAVGACSPAQMRMAPQNDEALLGFRHEIRVVAGTTCSFLEDGTPLVFGGPVCNTLDRSTYALAYYGVVPDLEQPDEVRALIEVARDVCEASGFDLAHEGLTAIAIANDATLMVEFCVPSDVTLPHFSQAGDRVPR